jgi:hypothetical protein
VGCAIRLLALSPENGAGCASAVPVPSLPRPAPRSPRVEPELHPAIRRIYCKSCIAAITSCTAWMETFGATVAASWAYAHRGLAL